jgi:hypothetical protein
VTSPEQALKSDRTVRGFHATSVEAARALVEGAPIRLSTNPYDWLGEGVYFWEEGPGRAWQWARKEFGGDAAVVSADIELGVCLDLTDTRCVSLVKVSHSGIAEAYRRENRDLPENKGKARYRDCLVINYLVDNILQTIQTIRAPFIEGDPIFPGSAIYGQSHIQLCVRDLDQIVSPYALEPER